MRMLGCLMVLLAMVAGPVTVAGSPRLAPSHATLHAGVTPTGGMLSPAMASKVQVLRNLYAAQELEDGVYVGSEFCIACHQNYVGWRQTKHAQSLRKPMVQYSLVKGEGVTCDYNDNGIDDFIEGLDFNAISSPFDSFKPNAPVLSVENGAYYITIGQVQMPVTFINGGAGNWRERYAVRIPVVDGPTGYSDDVYFPPVQYDNRPNHWIPYKTALWWTPGHEPKIVPGMTRADVAAILKPSFSKNCIGCHTTGIKHLGKTADGEWDYDPYVAVLYRADDPHYFDYDGNGIPDILNVGCEACHGPGSAHILGAGDPSRIVNPANLGVDQANEVCGRCHNRVRSLPNKTFGWPYHDSTDTEWIPGTEPLSDFYVNNNELWPDDETSYEHNQHYAELSRSVHGNNPYEQLRCFDCHDAHNRSNDHQIVTHIESGGVNIATKYEDNTLCLACHAEQTPFENITKEMVHDYRDNLTAIGSVVSAHTHHPSAPERTMGLSRCTECHMSSVANAQRASNHRSHTMFVVPPEKTLIYRDDTEGMTNTCAVSCHAQKVNVWDLGMDSDMQVWNSAFDLDTATLLEQYLGPEGQWWVTALPGGDGSRTLDRERSPLARKGQP